MAHKGADMMAALIGAAPGKSPGAEPDLATDPDNEAPVEVPPDFEDFAVRYDATLEDQPERLEALYKLIQCCK